MRATGNRPRANSSTPMLDRSYQPSSVIRGNDKDNGGDDHIVLGTFTVDARPQGGNVAAAPEFTAISLDIALERKLQRCKRKMDLAASRLINIQRNGGDTGQARKELEAASQAYITLSQSIDPAYIFDTINTEETRRAYASYQREWQAYEKAMKEGGQKHFYNLAAGGFGNLVCFGLGGIAGALSGSAALALAINTLAWTFAEPLISMIRATTINNPYLDFYMPRQHLQARAIREWLDGSAELERNRKFPWLERDSKDGEPVLLNAGEWLERTSWRGLWAGKHFTDDLIYHVYSAMYGFTNCLPEFIDKSLYDPSTRQGIARFAGIRTAGGFVAGAFIQEGMQLLRASAMAHTGGRETVTKPREFWRKEARYVGLLLDRIEERLAAHGVDPSEATTLKMLRASLEIWHRKAIAKSALHSSMMYEWRVMVQSKREAVGIDPEVPGKRLDTAASLIGKGLCQVPGIVVGHVAGLATAQSTAPWVRWTAYLVPPLVSIAWGFSFRREFEVVARTMLGAAQGVSRRCCCTPEQDDEAVQG
jgi:hypothetical protein